MNKYVLEFITTWFMPIELFPTIALHCISTLPWSVGFGLENGTGGVRVKMSKVTAFKS